MKAILMSIKPKWCELIFSGEKTIEVRKIAPKLKTPYKAYVYETLGNEGAGAVVGEFVCDEKHDIKFTGASYTINNDISLTNSIARQSCLWFDDMFSYLGVRGGAALHITAPKRYDTPKELYEFTKACDFRSNCGVCTRKKYLIEDGKAQFMGCDKRIYRAPQSWCYVEEIEE